MRDYEELVAKLRSISECEFDDRPWETVKEAADAIEELVDDRKALKRLVERRKSVGKVPFDPKNSESRNAMIELHRIDSLIVDGVVFTFNNDKTSHMPLPEPQKEKT